MSAMSVQTAVTEQHTHNYTQSERGGGGGGVGEREMRKNLRSLTSVTLYLFF